MTSCCKIYAWMMAVFMGSVPVALGAGFILDQPRLPTNRSDYLIVAHETLVNSAIALATYRFGNPDDHVIEPAVVLYSKIIAAYADSGDSLHRLKAFLRDAITRWERRPERVLLMGDAAIDTGCPTGVTMIPTRQCSIAVSDDWFVTFDSLPSVAIGRIPAQSDEEARVVVDKIIRFEQSSAARRRKICLITDDDRILDSPECPYSPYYVQAENAAKRLPAGLEAVRLHSVSYPLSPAIDKPQMTRDILAVMNNHPLMVCFFGHASRTQIWTHEAVIFADLVVPKIEPGSLFILATYTCLNTAFQFEERCVGEKFLFAPGAGAVAVLGSSGMRTGDFTDVLADANMHSLTDTGVDIGLMMLAAKRKYYGPGMNEVVLLGDPAMMIRAGTLACVQGDGIMCADGVVPGAVFDVPGPDGSKVVCTVTGTAPRIAGVTGCDLAYDYPAQAPVLYEDTLVATGGRIAVSLRRSVLAQGWDSLRVRVCTVYPARWNIGSVLFVNGMSGVFDTRGAGRVNHAVSSRPRMHLRGITDGRLARDGVGYALSGRRVRPGVPVGSRTSAGFVAGTVGKK